jgi:CxxC motif-containing protein
MLKTRKMSKIDLKNPKMALKVVKITKNCAALVHPNSGYSRKDLPQKQASPNDTLGLDPTKDLHLEAEIKIGAIATQGLANTTINVIAASTMSSATSSMKVSGLNQTSACLRSSKVKIWLKRGHAKEEAPLQLRLEENYLLIHLKWLIQARKYQA